MKIKGRNEAEMKRLSIILILFSLILICFSSAVCEPVEGLKILADSDAWSWDPGAYNLFSGIIDLSQYIGKELTITVTSDLQNGGDQEDQRSPLFTVINGHRITMLKQKNTAGFTPDAEQPVFEFSASVKLPEKGHVRSVKLEFTVSDENGTELNKLKDTISIGDHSSGRDSGAFYIPVEIGTINTVIAITAAVIWMIVLIRHIAAKKKRIGD